MCSLFLAIAMVFGALIYATRASVVSSEMRSAEADMAHTLAAIDHEFDALGVFAVDWAEWDELYLFLKGKHPTFVDTNIDTAWMERVRIDFVSFYDTKRSLVYSWSDPRATPPRPFSTGRADRLVSRTSLRDVDLGTGERHGFVMAGPTPLLVSANPVVTSEGEGPQAGVAVFGRTLDEGTLRDIIGHETADVKTFNVVDGSAPPDVREAAEHLSPTDRVHVRLTRPHVLTGYGLLLSPDGEPVGVVRTRIPSVAYGGTPQLMSVVICALLFLGVGWSTFTFGLVEKMSLSRMTWLKNAVAALSGSGDEKLRLDITRVEHGDEISDVAEEINGLLDVIETTQEAQAQSEQRNRALIENMADAVFVVDVDGTITYASPQAESIVGIPGEAIRNMHYAEILSADSQERVQQLLASPNKLRARQILDVSFVRWDSSVAPVELSVSPVKGPDDSIIAVQWIARDVAERKRFERQLVRLANHDHLTGLFNRRRFEEELTRRLAESRRRGSPAALLWLDLDGFKEINDAFGHGVGDEILIGLADTLRTWSRAEHTVSRLGGDEFAVLLPQADAAEAHGAATRLLEEIRTASAHHNGHDIRVTASIGIAVFPDHATNAEELLSRADLAMYHAKQEGRNRVGVFTPNRNWEAELTERHSWAGRIESAIAGGRLVAFAQPIVDMVTGRPDHYELLVRMIENDKMVLPGEFLAHAESLDLIRELDEWMLAEAISVLSHCKSPERGVRLAVNLSGNGFGDQTFLRRIKKGIDDAGIDPSRLGFEITETALIRNMGQALHFMGELKDMGCTFSLDDFGSGFSSFYYLRHLPIDVLKIDGSLIIDLPRNPREQHLVKAIIELARGLGIPSIAECVEDEATMVLLREFGVSHAQGVFIAPPLPLRDLFCGDVVETDSERGSADE